MPGRFVSPRKAAAQTPEQGLGGRTPAASFFSGRRAPAARGKAARCVIFRRMHPGQDRSPLSHPEGLPESDEGELQTLLKAISGREQNALGLLYDRTLGRVYGLILRVVRNPADAEEVVSDLYLQVWERAGDYHPERGSVIAWLKTMAWSRAVDRQRRSRRFANEVELHPDREDAAYMECESLSAEAAVSAWSSASAVQAAFSVLSDVQKKILTLAFHQDMTHQDIAALTELPLGTVKSHARRGLTALREALGAEGRDHV